jgi:zinc protease
MKHTLPIVAVLLAFACSTPSTETDLQTILLPSPQSPLIALRVTFDAGSIYDPPGREGLAALTASMISDAGTAKRTYTELGEALYPLAVAIRGWTDREISVFSAQVHRERLDELTDVFVEVLLEPGFREEDFERNREQLLGTLTSTLRSGNDELLGLEMIQQAVFAGHPYGHASQGTVEGLAAVTLDDVKTFYRDHYVRSSAMLGIAGGYPEGYDRRLQEALGALPEGGAGRLALPSPTKPSGRRFTLIRKATRAVGLHFAFPIAINRSDDDYYPLMVANSFLGEHRTLHGRLMQQLREIRGLNYGDYSYIEHWPRPTTTSNPLAGFPRRQQYFSVWIRPVVPGTEHFALRNALYEVDRLLERGLSEEEFSTTRDFLINYSKLWARDLGSRLGHRMDSAWYGMPPYLEEIEERLAGLSRQDVLDAIARHLQIDDFEAVIITSEPEALQQRLEEEAPSPMSYPVPQPDEVEADDREIEVLKLAPSSIRIVDVEDLFQR